MHCIKCGKGFFPFSQEADCAPCAVEAIISRTIRYQTVTK